ncbi:hypothetical protein EVAR_19126_1 [Eumeta japonica]|uniref:Uncharacterized protein n=1 Tax=Eumeta variegata TaxID=151549 RepID=A0A4C1SQI1_EUMVA|nr:hypothetical protein EVAR_19126_1 [Eumeta japonica]
MDMVEKEVKATHILGFYDVRRHWSGSGRRWNSQKDLLAGGSNTVCTCETPLPQRGSAHTIIVTSKETADTADHVIEKIRRAVDARR